MTISETMIALRDELNNGSILDVGNGVEKNYGLSRAAFVDCRKCLEEDGYGYYTLWFDKEGKDRVKTKGVKILVPVLAPKDMDYNEAFSRRFEIKTPIKTVEMIIKKNKEAHEI